jgi:uncharacterized protein (DUF4415 family)
MIVDDENPIITSRKGFQPALEVMPELVEAMKRARGRPRKESPKKEVKIRLDADILMWLKEEGQGYQTRLNALLRDIMEKRL